MDYFDFINVGKKRRSSEENPFVIVGASLRSCNHTIYKTLGGCVRFLLLSFAPHGVPYSVGDH